MLSTGLQLLTINAIIKTMDKLTYTSVKEMVNAVNDMLTNGQYVSDGWQENKMYVLEIAQGGKDKNGFAIPTANIRIRLPMPE